MIFTNKTTLTEKYQISDIRILEMAISQILYAETGERVKKACVYEKRRTS